MKRFFANFVIILSVLLITVVAIPWNNLGQWGIHISFLDANELMVKGGIGALLFLLSLVFLIISVREYNYDNEVSEDTANAAFLPMWLFSVAATVYAGVLAAFMYTHTPSTTSLIYLGGIGFLLLNLIGFGHLLSSGFKKRKNFPRIMIFVFLFQLVGVGGGVAYYVRTYIITNYASLYTYNYILAAAVTTGFYIVHLIILAIKRNRVSEEELLQVDYEPEKQVQHQPQQQTPVQKQQAQPTTAQSKKAQKKQHQEDMVLDPRKTLIVSKGETIQSRGMNMDPTTMLYEDVNVDPEFSQTSNQSRQINSIDYYIEKPKMFKPLDPTFDLLVEYIRELPNVVTKIADEKITFYMDRNPFLVLINYGNYYRMAFKYELEKGIRLIIKYPTISKNKSTKDDLWFKANNYGDLPKEVIYQIVKSSYDQSAK